MNSILDQLVSLLNMETIEENLFRGASSLSFRQLFGGQVLGQRYQQPAKRLTARQASSLHGYFYAPAMQKNQ